MNYLLKGELGFQGFIMSDWQAQHAGVATSFAGLDMTMPGDTSFLTGLSYWVCILLLNELQYAYILEGLELDHLHLERNRPRMAP
jgi:beta-glucosidase